MLQLKQAEQKPLSKQFAAALAKNSVFVSYAIPSE